MRGRSHCDHCRKAIPVRDLIPIFSFLLLRGRCRQCRERLGTEVIGIELLCTTIGVLPCLLLPVATSPGAGYLRLAAGPACDSRLPAFVVAEPARWGVGHRGSVAVTVARRGNHKCRPAYRRCGGFRRARTHQARLSRRATPRRHGCRRPKAAWRSRSVAGLADAAHDAASGEWRWFGFSNRGTPSSQPPNRFSIGRISGDSQLWSRLLHCCRLIYIGSQENGAGRGTVMCM